MSDIAVAQAVEYRDSTGRVKAAIITATPESMEYGPEPGTVHLTVFGGSVYQKRNVPQGDGPQTFKLV